MNAQEARTYIKVFREHTIRGTEYVEFPSGRIYLDDMTDEQAVKVAYGLMDIEAEATKKSLKHMKVS